MKNVLDMLHEKKKNSKFIMNVTENREMVFGYLVYLGVGYEEIKGAGLYRPDVLSFFMQYVEIQWVFTVW